MTGTATGSLTSSGAGSVSRSSTDPGAQRSGALAGAQPSAGNPSGGGLAAPVRVLRAAAGVRGALVRKLSSKLTAAPPRAKRLAGHLVEGVASDVAPASEAAQRLTAPAVQGATDTTEQLLSSASGTISGTGAQAGGEVETVVHASTEGLGSITGAGR